MIRPDAATVAIIFAGLALAVLGVAVPVVARRLGASTAPSVLPAAMELAPATPSPVADEQAA